MLLYVLKKSDKKQRMGHVSTSSPGRILRLYLMALMMFLLKETGITTTFVV
jgi:hypothetical protein